MLRQFARRLAHTARLTNKKPLIHENGLYYGKFTKEEYEKAKEYVTTQYQKLEHEIKGEHNVRENVGKIPQFPTRAPPKKVRNLLDFFKETINTTGPISLSAYMRQCLTHPELGYYTTRDPLARSSGDFVTSPEISSVFGEMIGIWFYTQWEKQGKPGQVNFVEFGPGRGTLAHDVLQVFHKFVGKSGASPRVGVTFIEASLVLRKEQWKYLCHESSELSTTETGHASTTKWGGPVTWVESEKDIVSGPDDCNYVVAHEFFDALPVKSFSRTKDGWRELLVEHTQAVVNTQPKLPSAEESGDAVPEELDTEFHLTTAIKETPSSAVPTLSTRFKDLPVGTRIEVCADAEFYMNKIIELVQTNGAALIIDYGLANEIPLNSVRGIYKHKFVSPFYKPGEVDLSVDVDFESLKLIAEPKTDVFGPKQQGDWLHELGIGYRFDQLIKAANLMANKELLYESYTRLTAPEEMGKIYKFMAMLPKGSAAPVGFGGSV